MPEPAKKKDPDMTRLRSTEELATDRFGSTEGLAVVSKTTMELAAYYIKKFKLDNQDPDVGVVAAALAFARHKQFTLLRQLESDLHERVLTTGMSYGEALYRTASTGAHDKVHREIDRLHARCTQYLHQLTKLKGEQEED
jgi:hypothetical protein